jgi:glycosyltransferase involved in cell wall biosynthesis
LERLRVAVICDFAEEGWPSMDLVGEMLCAELERRHAGALAVTRVRPEFIRRLSRRANGAPAPRARFNVDRALNRFFDYPRLLRRVRECYDVFHVVDHSYAHLVHELAAARTVVTCHDLDAFRCLLADGERRTFPLRAMARRILGGMRRAACVSCDSVATRDALAANALVSRERLVVIPNGVHPACSPVPDEAADAALARMLGRAEGPELLHVGSTIPRKRIDLLLRAFAAARREYPALRLIKAGGALTVDQRRLARELGVTDAIVTMPFLASAELAALYRRVALVMLPSEAEGFGLPLAEALACGTPVLASDIAPLREVGGDVVDYCPMGDVAAWTAALLAKLRERVEQPARWAERREAGIRRAACFSWAEYADRCAALYSELVGREAPRA